MNGDLTDSWTRKTRDKKAAESVFPRVLAPVSTTLASFSFRSSSGVTALLRDGTDPLLGGHRAAPAASRTMVGSSSGGRS